MATGKVPDLKELESYMTEMEHLYYEVVASDLNRLQKAYNLSQLDKGLESAYYALAHFYPEQVV